jgi:hypothetical protein
MTYPTFFNLPQPVMAECFQVATAASQGFQFLVYCFVAENIAMGITQTNIGPVIAEALAPVMIYGNNGALWEALAQLDKVVITPEMAPYLTNARRIWMKNQLTQLISEL